MKRLIVCSDGTWNDAQSSDASYTSPTNVAKIYQAIPEKSTDGIVQLAHYLPGLGTKINLSGFDRMLQVNFGVGIDDNIQAGYQFLCRNYEPGDEIYLFGFSRGAYTVRSLAGLIYKSGLLQLAHIDQIPAAYRLYRDRTIKPSAAPAQTFRQQYSHQIYHERVPIQVLGCWDTVGALGVPNLLPFAPLDRLINRNLQFHDTRLSRIVRHALHAIAIDENRRIYNPTPMQFNPEAEHQILRQQWFAGVHRGVGGGSTDTQGLSDITLQWMVEQMQQLGLGLAIDLQRVKAGIQPNPLCPFTNQLPFFDQLLNGFQPFHRTIPLPVANAQDTIAASVVQRWQQDPTYRPAQLRLTSDLTLTSR
jgi:uncharacterized protein (DUF2235 family)